MDRPKTLRQALELLIESLSDELLDSPKVSISLTACETHSNGSPDTAIYAATGDIHAHLQTSLTGVLKAMAAMDKTKQSFATGVSSLFGVLVMAMEEAEELPLTVEEICELGKIVFTCRSSKDGIESFFSAIEAQLFSPTKETMASVYDSLGIPAYDATKGKPS